MPYTKLDHNIIFSTVWELDAEMTKVWVTMLALRDPHGIVKASLPGLATVSRVPLEKTREAIQLFLGPDPDSRTPDHEGRRIEKLDGGWRLLNHRKYTYDNDERRRARDRERKRRARAREKDEATTPAAEAEELERRRRAGGGTPDATNEDPLPFPKHQTCPHCQAILSLRQGKYGWFYGHGKHGGALGCRFTCDAEDYDQALAAATAQPKKQPLCPRCNKYAIAAGESYCAPCLVELERDDG